MQILESLVIFLSFAVTPIKRIQQVDETDAKAKKLATLENKMLLKIFFSSEEKRF